MAIGQRRRIVNELVTQFKKINGGASTFNPSYTYSTNLYNNVYRGIRFIDEVNDFPSVYLQADDENRFYESAGLIEAQLPIIARCYVKSTNPRNDLDNLAQDIEHVIYNFSDTSTLDIMDMTIDIISNDEGLLDPYGTGEIFFTVLYRLNR